MKRNQVNSILINQTKRRNVVFAYICMIIIVFVLIVSSFFMYTNRNMSQYVSYNEESDIKYRVYYKNNDFFDESYLESNKQYIASLIDSIKTNFNYKMNLDDTSVEYKYSYRIESNVIVKDKNTKNLIYEKSNVLLEEKEKITSFKEVYINEDIVIDYDLYNEKIKRLVNVYDLDNTESYLNVSMYINIIGSCEKFEDSQAKIITLSIPLSEDTIAIDFIDNTVDSSNNVMKCNVEDSSCFVFLICGIIFAVFELCLIVSVIDYEIKTRTAETIYEKELKKILNNYGSCIQMLNSDFSFTNYQLLRIESFSDMLEISDRLRQPILMRENNEKTGAYFVIPSNTKLIYVYRLKVSDIEKEINKKNKNI